jgi:3-deoxy-D-manno-octulosonic-acid transferase
LLNGRISRESLRRYGCFRSFFRRALKNIQVFGMQSRDDAYRIIRMGADPRRVHVTGNMKFDTPASPEPGCVPGGVRREMGIGEDDLLFVAGSTHAGEEEILLEVYLRLRASLPRLKMLLAPRHPERCHEIFKRITAQGISVVKQTQRTERLEDAGTDVVLLDTIGDLARAYSAGHVVFVGGSLVPVGGHNLLEPVLYRKPVLFGPHTENTAEIAASLKASGGGIEVRDADECFTQALGLLNDPSKREKAGKAAFQILERNRGAVDRNLALVLPMMEDE